MRALVGLLGVTLLLSACGASGGSEAATTKAAAPDSTAAASADPTTSTSDETTTTAGSDGASRDTACDLVSPDDLTAAGIEGDITEEGDVSDNFSLGTAPPSTACAYTVKQGSSVRGVTIVLVDGAGPDVFDGETTFVDDPKDLDDVGDRAVFEQKASDLGDGEKDTIWAEQADRFVKISSVDATVTPQAALQALARTILAA